VILRKKICLVALLAVLVLPGAVRSTYAQESGGNSSSVGESRPEAQSAKAEEGPDAELKRSPAVQFIARKAGLSVDRAYQIVVGVNFAAVLVVLWLLTRKALPAMFKSRNEAIQKRMEEARKASEEARRRLTEVEGRLSRLDTEIEHMRHEAEEAGRAEEERIRASSEEERRRIVQSAEQEIAVAASTARRELKVYAAELAVELAKKKIDISPGADQVLVRDFTAQIGKDGN
jgi:F-type H+-transporting ATPase subunit b